MSRTASLSSWIFAAVSLASLVISLTLLTRPEPNEKSTSEVAFELPEEIKPPQLSLPESPLLKAQSSQEMLSRYALRAGKMRALLEKQRDRLDETMMNGELDRYRAPAPGSTDPDSMWKGQVDRANRTLHETGMGHLNLRSR